MGLPDAPVTIIEYSDFQCSYCQQFALTVGKELKAAYIDSGKVRLLFRFINAYEESLQANQAAASAAEQGKFWPYHDLLMEQRASPKVNDLPIEKLEDLAQQLGLDMTLFKASLESGKHDSRIWQDDADGRALGVTGTPTFFIDGIKMAGGRSLQDFQDIIDPILQSLAK
ncbi:DsbA family protein [Chloroflexota bacterium]